MRLSIKEKAGIVDTSRIFEGAHLAQGFIESMADEEKKATLDEEVREEGERHFNICDQCSVKYGKEQLKPRDRKLPL